MAGIVELRENLSGLVSVINGIDKLRTFDGKVLLKEIIDLDQNEMEEIATLVKELDLTDDKLEELIEKLVGDNGKFVIAAIQLLRLFLPK